MSLSIFTILFTSGLISSFCLGLSNPSCGKYVKFTTQWGGRVWWVSFYIDDLCCGSVSTVEVKDADKYPTFVTGAYYSEDDYWYFDNNDFSGDYFTAPITVRVTNSNNETLTFTDVLQTVNPDSTYYADTNFCGQTNTTTKSSSVSKCISFSFLLTLLALSVFFLKVFS
eukprot:UN02178